MRVSPINLKVLAHTLDVEGFDAAPVLARCGFESIDAIQEDGEWVPLALFEQMLDAAVAHTGDPCFGLIAGKSMGQLRYGVITPVVLFSPSLRHMLTDIAHFAPLVVERSEMELEESPQGARIVIQPVVRDGVAGRMRMDHVATSAINMLKMATGGGHEDVLEVSFPYPCPDGAQARYTATFGPRIAFGRKDCGIRINPRVLDRKTATHDAVAYLAARTRVESALAAVLARTTIAERVRQLLLTAFPSQPAVGEAARQLGLSERGLRRQLWQAGAGYAELVQECQQLMAQRMLADARLSLKQIADALGFASVNSFHRAFRRWQGVTPSDWRAARHKGNGDEVTAA